MVKHIKTILLALVGDDIVAPFRPAGEVLALVQDLVAEFGLGGPPSSAGSAAATVFSFSLSLILGEDGL